MVSKLAIVAVLVATIGYYVGDFLRNAGMWAVTDAVTLLMRQMNIPHKHLRVSALVSVTCRMILIGV